MSLVLRHYLISGRVQGVGYRAFSQEQAESLGLKGWVRNLNSGEVEILAEGSPFALQEFEKALKEGPASSQVDGLKFDSNGICKSPCTFSTQFTFTALGNQNMSGLGHSLLTSSMGMAKIF